MQRRRRSALGQIADTATADRVWAGGVWWLCYNTKEFGWFDKDHINTIPTGLKVWAPCPLLCRWFSEAPAGGESGGGHLAGRSVLELGAGIGMLGIVMAQLGASRVVITDNSPVVLRIAAINARVNLVSNAIVAPLSFGSEEAREFRETYGVFDHIVGADIIYTTKAVRPVFESIVELLSERGTFSLGFVDRDETFVTELETVCKGLGFELVRSCFLVEALGGQASARPDNSPTGMLAELKRVLERIPKGGACFGEADEKVRSSSTSERGKAFQQGRQVVVAWMS